MPDCWNPEQYARFAAERSAPFDDLLALVEREPQLRIIDLGCGSGALTARLHRELEARCTLGIDSSPAMLQQTSQHANMPGLEFREQDIADFAARAEAGGAEHYDLVLSNAALHWLPDHPRLLAQLTPALAPGGQLAVQVPANYDHPSQRAAEELAAREPYAAALGGYVRVSPVLAPERYAELLCDIGFGRQRVMLVVYGHLLPDREHVAEWTRGSLLTEYERRLEPELFARFLDDYRSLLRQQLSEREPFFYTFKRILLWARR